ncbi:MAG: TolC family protein [Opitutales bacterium]
MAAEEGHASATSSTADNAYQGLPAQPLPADEGDILPLEAAIDQALAHNLGLTTARYRPANQRDNILIEESAFDSSLFGSTSLQEQKAAATTSTLDSASVPQSENRQARLGVDKRLSTGATVTADSGLSRRTSNNNAARNPDYSSSVGLNLRQPLLRDAWARVNLAPLARARLAADQSIFELRSNILDVIAETEIAYWNLAYARADAALIGSSIELAENLLEENRERQRLGLATPLEVLQAETELVNQQEDLIQAEQAIEDAKDALRQVMGNASFLDNLEADTLAVRKLPVDMSALRPMPEVVADTIRSDADALAQEKAIEVQRINKMLADDATRPSLDLVGGVDYLGRDTDGQTAFRGAYSADGYNWNVGLELRLPWGFREARARKRQAERNLEQEKVVLYDLKQQKALAARNVWRATRTGLQRIEVTRKALRLNEQSFEQERARYGSGLVAYRQVLEAQRDYDRARSNYLAAIIDTTRASVRLSRVDGTILERNGFSWEILDELSTSAPDLKNHPILKDISKN